MPQPKAIEVRGAHVHNLRNLDLDIPLHEIVGIAGVSGSGKSSLALGVLYAEGSRRYLEALSTYTRRRMTQAALADVDEIRYVPAALALRQRPGVPALVGVFDRLLAQGATVIVIEHDLDVIRGADYIIDMGPAGGTDGGRIVACGTPEEIARCPESVTGRYL